HPCREWIALHVGAGVGSDEQNIGGVVLLGRGGGIVLLPEIADRIGRVQTVPKIGDNQVCGTGRQQRDDRNHGDDTPCDTPPGSAGTGVPGMRGFGVGGPLWGRRGGRTLRRFVVGGFGRFLRRSPRSGRRPTPSRTWVW